MTTADWLLAPQQLLLGVTRGAVFHDGLGELARVRDVLAWYPDDVWRWMIACQWRRIASEEAFVGRTAEVGDELGSRLVAARLARELMRLWFLLSRTYWPYTKWFGSAFAQLPVTQQIVGALRDALAATDHAAREAALVVAYELTARRHNAAGLTEPLDPSVRPYYTRPFRVLMSERFVEATVATVTDRWLRSLALVGSVDQCVDGTDVLGSAARARGLRTLYSDRQVPDVHGRP